MIDEESSVRHKFNLSRLKPGDWFEGCKNCWQQYPIGSFGPTKCCVCGCKMYGFKVTEHDDCT